MKKSIAALLLLSLFSITVWANGERFGAKNHTIYNNDPYYDAIITLQSKEGGYTKTFETKKQSMFYPLKTKKFYSGDAVTIELTGLNGEKLILETELPKKNRPVNIISTKLQTQNNRISFIQISTFGHGKRGTSSEYRYKINSALITN